MQAKRVGIVDFCRSPITKAKGGALADLTSLEIGAQVIGALLERNPGLPREKLEAVVAGCAYPEAENGRNLAACSRSRRASRWRSPG